MKVHVLGACGSRTPEKSLISLLIDDLLVLDAGSITSSLDLKAQSKIKYILISHSHLDHIKDICFLADNRAFINPEAFWVFASDKVIEYLKKYILNNIIWPDFTKIPSDKSPVLILKEIPESSSFKVEEYTVFSVKVKHSPGARGYLISNNGKTIFYTGDTGFDKSFWYVLEKFKVDALFVDISYPDSLKDFALKTNHLTPSLFMECIKELNFLPSKIFAVHSKLDFSEQIKRDFNNLSCDLFEVTLLKGGEVFEI